MDSLKSTQDVLGICRHQGRKPGHRVFLRWSHLFWALVFPFGKCIFALATLSKSWVLLPEDERANRAFLGWTVDLRSQDQKSKEHSLLSLFYPQIRRFDKKGREGQRNWTRYVEPQLGKQDWMPSTFPTEQSQFASLEKVVRNSFLRL